MLVFLLLSSVLGTVGVPSMDRQEGQFDFSQGLNAQNWN
jgi:hypothetical protein